MIANPGLLVRLTEVQVRAARRPAVCVRFLLATRAGYATNVRYAKAGAR